MKYTLAPKRVDLNSGGKFVAVLNDDTAQDIDVMSMDRVRISTAKNSATAIVDLSEHFIKENEIGCFSDLWNKLNPAKGEKVTVEPIEKPESLNYIKRKMDGDTLIPDEINRIINDVMLDNLSDVELTAFMTAVYIRKLTTSETLALTKSIVSSGTTLNLKNDIILDKHCIGGVPGNRTTMLLVPIIASAGLMIPKTSSRSITSPAGTADAMEVLAPVTLKENEIETIVRKANGCIVWGGGVNLAAADDKLIRIRHPLKMDPTGVLLASILAKKKAVGATHVLIDIPVGKGTKIYDMGHAKELANSFMDLGTKLDMEIHCIITPGYDPVGWAIGPALEARETLRILEGNEVSPDLIEKSVTMAGTLLEISKRANPGEGTMMARQILQSGKACEKMKEIIELQGGDPCVKSSDIHIGEKTLTIKSQDDGRIHYMSNSVLSAVARAAGAPKDKGAGIYLYVEKGDKIKKGQKLLDIFAESDRKLDVAAEIINREAPVEMEKVILEEMSTENKKPFVLEFK